MFDDWLAFGEDWVQEWCLVCDSALALFRTAEGSKRHCTHVRKGHREKWKTAANCLSSPLLVFLTTICYPVWHAGGPMWTIGSDLGQEQVNLVWVLPSSQHNLFSCLFDLLRWKRKRKKKEITLFRIFAVFNFWLYTYLKPRCEYTDNDTLKCDI